MKAPSPAFSLYPKDIESDEACKVMDLRSFGGYMRLVLHAWTEGSIPVDHDRLSKILGVTRRTLEAIWPDIEPCFDVSPDDGERLIQRRLEKERSKQVQRSQENSENGRKGGRPPKSIGNNETVKRTVTGNKPTALDHETETKGRAPASSSSSFPSAKQTHMTDAAIDQLDDDRKATDERLNGHFRSIQASGDLQGFIDSLPCPKGRSPFSTWHWQRAGNFNNIPNSREGLTLLNILADNIEAKLRSQAPPKRDSKQYRTPEEMWEAENKANAS